MRKLSLIKSKGQISKPRMGERKSLVQQKERFWEKANLAIRAIKFASLLTQPNKRKLTSTKHKAY
jgi:hypothetical protein